MSTPDFLTLATFSGAQQTEAYLLKARLDEAGIDCILSGTNPSIYGEGCAIQIPPHEEKRALQIRREFEKTPDESRFPVRYVEKIVITVIVAFVIFYLIKS